MNEYIYRLWDTVEEVYWQTGKGKSVWNTAGFAKSAFTDKIPWQEKRDWSHKSGPYFDTQTRYIVHRFSVSFSNAEVL